MAAAMAEVVGAKQCCDVASRLGSGSTRVGGASLLCPSQVSLAHTTTQHLGEIGATEPTLLCLQDLERFRLLLGRQLQAALGAASGTDKELADAIGRVCADAHDLVDSAGLVLLRWVLNAREMSGGLLPNLRSSLAKGKRHASASLLGAAQSTIVEMRRMAEDLRHRYVQILETVLYLIQCTQVSLDYVHMVQEDERLAAEPAWSAAAALLQQALQQLKHAAAVLEECSNSWLFLHSIERSLIGMEADAQQLRNAFMSGDRLPTVPPKSAALCAALEDLCSKCYTVLTTDGWCVAL